MNAKEYIKDKEQGVLEPWNAQDGESGQGLKICGILKIKSNAEYTLAVYKDERQKYYHSAAGWGIDEGIMMKREYTHNPPLSLLYYESFDTIDELIESVRANESEACDCDVEIEFKEVRE